MLTTNACAEGGGRRGVVLFIITLIFCLLPVVLAFALGISCDDQRCTTHTEAQRTVLECRAKASNPDSICGPVPCCSCYGPNL